MTTRYFVALNYLIPFSVLFFIEEYFTLYIYSFLGSFVIYRFLSNYIDLYPESGDKIVLVLRDFVAELFIVFLILHGSEYAGNHLLFLVLLITLFAITQIKSENNIISFMVTYFPFDVPIVLWAIFQISLGNYLAASVFVAYAGWIYWYLKHDKDNGVAPLWAYGVWNAGLVCTFLSSLFFYEAKFI